MSDRSFKDTPDDLAALTLLLQAAGSIAALSQRPATLQQAWELEYRKILARDDASFDAWVAEVYRLGEQDDATLDRAAEFVNELISYRVADV